jgi:hypothetical protein
LEGYEINTPKSDLARVPEPERILFLLLGHLANELSVLKKLFFFCAHSEAQDKWQRRANNAQALVMARTLIGKLYEGWRLLDGCFFKSGLSRIYEPLLEADEREALSRLKKYFSKGNLIKDVRKKFSFHYSSDVIANAFETTPENEADPWQTCQTDSDGNTLYYSSELVINHATMEMIVPGRPEEATDRLFKESTEVARWFIDVIAGCMTIIVTRHFSDSKGKIEMAPVDIGPVQAMDAIRVPYFVSPPRSKNDE